ncbi:MAG: alcohol dehydrogenase catalytic domain-containing protein [Mycobacteriaceae bacterium]
MIQQARILAPGVVSVDRVQLPDCGPRDAVVEVHACGICGSDLSYIRLGGLAGPNGEPMALGHEMAGVVRQVGAEVSDVAVGDRVVVHPGDDDLGRIGNGAPEGGLADAVLVREAARGGRLFAVPDSMPLDVAALAEPVAVGMHAAEQADVTSGDRVAVFGCGPIGLAAIASLVDRGVADVVGIDLSARRRRLAEAMGASATVDPAEQSVWRELSHIHGRTESRFGNAPATEAFIEASGSDAVLTGIIDRAGRGARISVVALHYSPVPVNFLSVLMKELTIRGSMEYPARFGDAVDLLGRRDLSALITHRFPLGSIDAALDLLATGEECGKVMITSQ